MIFSRKGMTTFASIMIVIIIFELVGIFYFAKKKGFLGGKATLPLEQQRTRF